MNISLMLTFACPEVVKNLVCGLKTELIPLVLLPNMSKDDFKGFRRFHGALFGLFGCFSYLVPHAKMMFFIFPIPFGAWFTFLGLVTWNVAGCALRWGSFDYAAHLGGSVMGILYGWLIAESIKKQREKRMAIATFPRF